ncbi:hypothetical protein ACP3V5_16995 [Vibrio maritimus]
MTSRHNIRCSHAAIPESYQNFEARTLRKLLLGGLNAFVKAKGVSTVDLFALEGRRLKLPVVEIRLSVSEIYPELSAYLSASQSPTRALEEICYAFGYFMAKEDQAAQYSETSTNVDDSSAINEPIDNHSNSLLDNLMFMEEELMEESTDKSQN